MKYQFRIDGRPAGPIRNEWEDAANDAVSAGYGLWVDREHVKLSPEAEIARLK